MKLAPKSSVKLALLLKCLVVTTSGIAGFQGISIKYHTLDKDDTQIHPVGSFILLHEVHYSGGFNAPRGNLRCSFQIMIN